MMPLGLASWRGYLGTVNMRAVPFLVQSSSCARLNKRANFESAAGSAAVTVCPISLSHAHHFRPFAGGTDR